MDTTSFEAALRADGYLEIDTRKMAPNFSAQPHTHSFDVRALMLAGELTLTYDGASRTYRAGDVFALAAGCVHAEQFGPEGATYVVGRRHQPSQS